MFSSVPSIINYYYSEFQPVINFHEGLPTNDAFDVKNQLIVLDDLINESKQSGYFY